MMRGGTTEDRTLCRSSIALIASLALSAACGPSAAADGAPVGQIKDLHGVVTAYRAGNAVAAKIGDMVFSGEQITTGEDGGFGITFNDRSMISAGPDSELAITKFEFDSVTRAGTFLISLAHGDLVVVTGEIAEQAPDAMGIVIPGKGTVRGKRKFLIRYHGGKSSWLP